MFTDIVVDKFHDLRRRSAHARPVVDHDIGRHHEERGRHALVRDISDPHSQMIVIDQREIVKVSSHFLGRRHGAVDIEVRSVRESRIPVRQRAVLDLSGKRELRVDPFSLCRYSRQVLYIAHHIRLHLVDGTGQVPYLVKFADVSELLALRILSREAGRLVGYPPDGVQHPFLGIDCRQTGCQYCKKQDRNNDPEHEIPDRVRQFADRTLYAQKGSDFPCVVPDRDDRGDMRMNAFSGIQAVDRLILRLILIQCLVRSPVFLVRGIPLMSDLPLFVHGIIHGVVDGIEHRDEMTVITLIHIDHVYQRDVHVLAVGVHDPLCPVVLFRLLSSKVLLDVVAVDQRGRRIRHMIGCRGIFFPEGDRKTENTDRPDDDAEHSQQQYDRRSDVERHIRTQFAVFLQHGSPFHQLRLPDLLCRSKPGSLPLFLLYYILQNHDITT